MESVYLEDGDQAMKTTQAWTWLAAGVLALGLNGLYHDGGAAWAHGVADEVVARVTDQTGALVNLASERADRFLKRADLVAARDGNTSCKLASAMARVQEKIVRTQSGMARVEAMSARREAVLARVEANRARIEADVARVRLSPVAFNTVEIPEVACPRVHVSVPRIEIPRVNIPRPRMVRISAPAVRVEMLGDGPI
jgi:hypothetical protein